MSNSELDTTDAPAEIQYGTLQVLEKPVWTFFYEKEVVDEETGELLDKEVFACNEQEAGLFGKKYKFIGSSDGTTYRNFILKSGVKKGQRIPIDRIRAILKGAFEAELAVAKENRKNRQARRPTLQNVHFDSSVLMHQNANEIMRGFHPVDNG